VLVAGCILALFFLYLHQSRTQAVDADGAGNVLQAWDMLHGNPLLRGWWLSDVSFYTTELPQYALIAWVRGLGPDVVHVGGAMTYLLVMICAALLAKGDATGRDAAIRVLVPVGIMLGPQVGVGSYVLLLNPAHVGTGVPVLLTWLVLDRLKQQWYVPIIVGVLLTWGAVADPLVTYIAAAPLVFVALLRLLGRRDAWWFNLGLAAAGGASYGLSTLILHTIKSAGGFSVAAPVKSLTTWAAFHTNLRSTFEDVLLLFGADLYRVVPQTDIFQQPANPHGPFDIIVATVHLVGLALVCAAVAATLWRFWRRATLIEQLILVGIAVDFIAFLVRARPDQNLTNSRQIVLVLPLGAVLAGRFVARFVAKRRAVHRGRVLAALALVFGVYSAGLLYNLHVDEVPAQAQEVADWLEQHDLHYGVAGYWGASPITVDSGNRVKVRPVVAVGNYMVPAAWESSLEWYDPHKYNATFAVIDNLNASYAAYLTEAQATTALGKPAERHQIGAYTILIWHNKNLLDRPGA